MKIDTTQTDVLVTQLAERVSQTRAATWERAKWLPLVLLAVFLIATQEGLAEMMALPDEARNAVENYGLPAEFVGLLALGFLLLLGINTYRRTMRRVSYTGLEAA